MAIKYPRRFKEATPAGFDGVFDWDFLLPAFTGTKIEPMDIDCVVERHGKFLLFETKEPGVPIPKGQQITLKTLVYLGRGAIHLIVLYGKYPSEINDIEEWYYHKGQIQIKSLKCNAEQVLAKVNDWFQWASQFTPLQIALKYVTQSEPKQILKMETRPIEPKNLELFEIEDTHKISEGTRKVISKPDRPCGICKSNDWWWRPAGWGPGEWLCNFCHPNPNNIGVTKKS